MLNDPRSESRSVFARRWLLTLLIAVLSVWVAAGSEAERMRPAFEGRWEGFLSLDGGDALIIIELEPDSAGGLAGSIKQPVGGMAEAELTDISVEGSRLSIVWRNESGGSRFKGELSAGGDQVSGEMSDADGTYAFGLWRREDPASFARAGS